MLSLARYQLMSKKFSPFLRLDLAYRKNFAGRPLQKQKLLVNQDPTPQNIHSRSPRQIHTVLHTRLAKFKSGGRGVYFLAKMLLLAFTPTPPVKGTQNKICTGCIFSATVRSLGKLCKALRLRTNNRPNVPIVFRCPLSL